MLAIVSAAGIPHDRRRVCVWHKANSRTVARFGARDAYEALVVVGGRRELLAASDRLDNVLSWSGRQPSHPGALVGMKPAAFSEWMFRMLGARRGDTLDDLFPGSGAVSRAWRDFSRDPTELDARVVRPSRFAGSTTGDRRR